MVDKVWPLQRWDVGKWDSATTWDGQLGFNALLGVIQVNFLSAGLQVSRGTVVAQTLAIHVAGVPCALLYSTRSVQAGLGNIVVNGNDVGFSRGYRLDCSATAGGEMNINVQGIWCTLTLFQQPGPMEFGIPVRLTRW